MEYGRILSGTFIERPNRFIANVDIGGKSVVCHVKNTGRCKELLIPGAEVFLEEASNPMRKTGFDLVAVRKNGVLFNIDSQAPNKVFGEWLKDSGYFRNIEKIKPECFFGKSRFDFYFEYDGKRAFAEVKGVTLEREGSFLFPDAPTERGVRHIEELCSALDEGFEAYVVFILQAKGAKVFSPNKETHPEFAEALIRAEQRGVSILCLDCEVTERTLSVDEFVPYVL